jgi:Transcriptional regulator C-terminal region
VTIRFGLFQHMPILLGDLNGPGKVFPSQFILLPELIYQADAKVRLAPLLERAVHEELTALLLTWLKEASSGEKQGSEPLETIASVIGWAIFGTAVQWSQEDTNVSLEEMADITTQVILEGVARLIPDELPG